MIPFTLLATPPAESRPAAPVPASEAAPAPAPDPTPTSELALAPSSSFSSAPRPHYGISTRAALGASYQRLYSVNIASGELELAFGGRAGNQSGFLFVDVDLGRTEYGLHTQGYHAGALGEWAIGRFRYGISARVGALFIRRATDHDDSLSSPSIGARAHVAWDLLRTDGGHALFLELGLRGDFYVPLVYGPNVLLGYRWESDRRLGGKR